MKIVRWIMIEMMVLMVGISIATIKEEIHPQSVYASIKKLGGHRIDKPRLRFKYSTINENTRFDPYKGLIYYYTKPDKVKFSVKDYVNTEKPGRYVVVYHVKDKAGYNFTITHYIRVRKIFVRNIYNPNAITSSSNSIYHTSPIGTSFKLVPEFNVKNVSYKGIKWSSSDSNVASVSSDGKVVPKRDGVTLIIVTFNRQSFSTPVLVSEGELSKLSNSDNVWSRVNYDKDLIIKYYETGTLKQLLNQIWITNGSKFAYAKNIFANYAQQNKTGLDYNNGEHLIDAKYNDSNLDGISKSFFKSGDQIVLQTQDELGKGHTYIGSYRTN